MNKNIGFWWDIVNCKMPHAQFLLQENAESVNRIFKQSNILTFTTDLGDRLGQPYDDCAKIPVCDPEADQIFYYSFLKKNQKILEGNLLQ